MQNAILAIALIASPIVVLLGLVALFIYINSKGKSDDPPFPDHYS